MEQFRFSGHETFPCRYAWLPKAAREVEKDALIFASASKRQNDAMVRLGVGKNMVNALQFWAEITEIITPTTSNGYKVTPFGRRLLLDEDGKPGLDPYLEDIQTLWLLHWKMATQVKSPMFAWDFLLNDWQQEIARSLVLRVFQREANLRHKRELSAVTLAQHFDIFLHTYVPTRGRKGEVVEDSLDSPFVELELLQRRGFGEQSDQPGKAEPVYAFRREAKPEIGDALFAYCVSDFWQRRHQNEQTLSFELVAVGRGSPGQIFKLPEEDIRARLEAIERATDGQLIYEDSSMTPRLMRALKTKLITWEEIYAAALA